VAIIPSADQYMNRKRKLRKKTEKVNFMMGKTHETSSSSSSSSSSTT